MLGLINRVIRYKNPTVLINLYKSLVRGPIFEKSYEDLRKFLRLMKILGKTYDNADFRKILRKT